MHTEHPCSTVQRTLLSLWVNYHRPMDSRVHVGTATGIDLWENLEPYRSNEATSTPPIGALDSAESMGIRDKRSLIFPKAIEGLERWNSIVCFTGHGWYWCLMISNYLCIFNERKKIFYDQRNEDRWFIFKMILKNHASFYMIYNDEFRAKMHACSMAFEARVPFSVWRVEPPR